MQATIRPTRTISPVYPGFVPEMLYVGTSAVTSPISYTRTETTNPSPRCANESGSCSCSCCGGAGGGVPTVTTRVYCDCWSRAPIRNGKHGCGCVVRESTREMTAAEWRRVAAWINAGRPNGFGWPATSTALTSHFDIDDSGNVTVEINKEPAND